MKTPEEILLAKINESRIEYPTDNKVGLEIIISAMKEYGRYICDEVLEQAKQEINEVNQLCGGKGFSDSDYAHIGVVSIAMNKVKEKINA